MKKVLVLLLVLALTSCYRFLIVDVGEAKTYAVSGFQDLSLQANPDYISDFEIGLADFIRENTRLIEVPLDENPDLEFTGSIKKYSFEEQEINANDQAQGNKFVIALQVTCINHLNDTKGWKQQFLENLDLAEGEFPPSDAVEQESYEELNERFNTAIFNRSFSDW